MKIDFRNMPKLGFGMMRLPKQENDEIDLKRACDMADRFLDAGFWYFDTAYLYHKGCSEKAVKTMLTDRYDRERFTVTSKLPLWHLQKYEDADRIFAEQLERTGLNDFDVYFLHSIEDNSTAPDQFGLFEWLRKKKESGDVRHIGFSYHGTAANLDRLLTEHPEIEVVQVQLNYKDWDSPLIQSGAIYEVLRKHDQPYIVMEPIRGGALADLPQNVREHLAAVRPDLSPAAWALSFAATRAGVATVLSGMSTEAQMDENIATVKALRPFTEAEEKAVWEAGELLKLNPTVPCTACRYCVEGCPQSIEIPELFRALNDVRMQGDTWRAHNFYDGMTGGRAKDCIACGQCEGICPQHLPIIKLMREVSDTLDHPFNK